MDSSNPQHYQPLSHALRLPIGANATVSPSNTYIRKPARREEEEDEDAEEDVVEQQLNRDQLSRPTSPAEKSPSNPDVQQQPIIHQYEPDQKRRPGRPRGSKNRKRESQPPTKQDQPAAPQNPGVNAQNKQYYEFQWRVLNLCGEFYRAAEELVKDTNPLIIAQCYATAESTVDPLVMLKDAKRVCDNLIANPSRLIANPPPPMYPVIPTLYQPPGGQPVASTSTAPPTVINQPQSFVVSMGAPPPTQYPVYATPYQPPYYPHYPGYPPPPPGTVYYQQPPPPPTVQPPTTHQPTPTPTPPSYAVVPTTISTAAGNQGSWSDAEVERLKSLVDESKANNPTGDLNWDWVITQFGNDRTRHQILIKATSLGLKESSTRQVPSRGTKRRRDGDGSVTPPPAPPSASPSGANTNTTPTESQGPATPAASPTMHKPSHSSSAPKSTPTPNLPWPMPTVAVNTTSPVMTPSSVDRSSSYYRPRPSESSKPIMGPSHGHGHIQHQFMYHPNSNGGSGK